MGSICDFSHFQACFSAKLSTNSVFFRQRPDKPPQILRGLSMRLVHKLEDGCNFYNYFCLQLQLICCKEVMSWRNPYFEQAGDRAAKNTTDFIQYPQHRHKRRRLSYQQVVHNAEMYARANLTNILHSNIVQKALGLYKSL